MAESQSRFRHLVTFGTDDGAPSASVVASFREHALALTAVVPTELRAAFLNIPHDLSEGSDRLFMTEGLITQAAAETWAADRILAGKVGLLTIFHHARSLYEAHAVAYWMMGDLDARWQRVMKDHLRERDRFEKEMALTMGSVPSDISVAGRALLDDDSVKLPPSMFDMVNPEPQLRYDLGFFWKYSSIHIHPGGLGTASIDADSERTTIEQILAGVIRHASGAYRRIATHFAINDPGVITPLEAAETWARYPFELPIVH